MSSEEPDVDNSWIIWISAAIAILFVVPIVVPHFTRSHRRPSSNHCIANLKQIDGAKEQFALEKKKEAGAVVGMGDLVGTDAYIKNTPVCPAGGVYTVNVIGQPPTCSIGSNAMPPHVLPE